MPDFSGAPVFPAQPTVIGTGQLLFTDLVAQSSSQTTFETASGAWPSANLAIFLPMPISTPYTATKMFVFNGASVSGNIDVGIYDSQGNKVVSIGSTAQAGTTGVQSFDITDTLLNPGLYYLACAMDNATGLITHFTHPALNARTMGIVQMASAFPLPATATFATMAQAFIPTVCVTNQAVI